MYAVLHIYDAGYTYAKPQRRTRRAYAPRGSVTPRGSVFCPPPSRPRRGKGTVDEVARPFPLASRPSARKRQFTLAITARVMARSKQNAADALRRLLKANVYVDTLP